MRKHILALLLLVPILLIPLVSCDGDVLGSLSDFMGKAGGNALLESGAVVVDTSQGAAIGDAAGALAGLTPPVPADPENPTDDELAEEAVYEAAYETEVKKVKKSITDALGSPTKTKALKEEMGKPIGAGDTPKKVKDALTDLNTGLEDDDKITLETQGDLVAAILMVEAVEKGKKIADALADTEGVQPTDEELLEFVSEALQVIEIVKTVSPANGVSLDALIADLTGDDEFMKELFRGPRAVSRDGAEDDALAYIEPIFDMLIEAIGTDPESEKGHIDPAGLQRLTSNFKIMRETYESMAPVLARSGEELDLPDVINYALSVIFTEANGFFKSIVVVPLRTEQITFAEALNDVIDWQNDEDSEGPAFIDEITDWEVQFNGYMEANEDKFEDIKETLEMIVAAVPDSEWLEEALEDFFSEDVE